MTPEEINKKAKEAFPDGVDNERDTAMLRLGFETAYKEISASPTIKGWVARDEDGALSFFGSKPYLNFGNWLAEMCIKLNRKLFPALKMKNGPMKVELPIIRK